jgi:hypothetical protein
VIRIKAPSKEKKRSDFLNHKVEKFDLLLSDPFFRIYMKMEEEKMVDQLV